MCVGFPYIRSCAERGESIVAFLIIKKPEQKSNSNINLNILSGIGGIRRKEAQTIHIYTLSYWINILIQVISKIS